MKTNEIIKLKVGEKHTIELKGGGTKGHQWVAFPETNKVISRERKYSSLMPPRRTPIFCIQILYHPPNFFDLNIHK